MTAVNTVLRFLPDFFRAQVLLFLLIAGLSAPAEAAPATVRSAGETWLLIDAASATLDVMRGEHRLVRFGDVAFGRLGTKPVHYKGDTSTPLGEFRIDGINPNSNYTLFFRLNYPTARHAQKALEKGKISHEQYTAIVNAEVAGVPPPSTTPLGGLIGIHGLGGGSLAMHRKYNWTRGCVALDNDQIRALAQYVKVGMRVVIR